MTRIQNNLLPTILSKEDSANEIVDDIEKKLCENDVYNIAITGPYGSGKSSILKTLQKKYSHEYLTISLATLSSGLNEAKISTKLPPKKKHPNDNSQPSVSNQKVNNCNDFDKDEIEYSILQQLIYKENIETLPNTRFRRIKYIKFSDARIRAFAIVTFIIAFAIAFEPDWMRIDALYQFFSRGFLFNFIGDLLSVIYMISFIIYVLMYIIRHSGSYKIKALNTEKTHIEFGEETSIFNKHLDEIIYFFEATKYDVVIIEDLDRFEKTDIFLKLRELNYILCSSNLINRKIRFIYAVRDDLFKNTSRVKFFDYIATVIPVINPSNSRDKMEKEMKDHGYTYFKKEDLKALSSEISDMRMLKNICNEYQQYSERLEKNSKLDHAKLLAMIIYKNIHPDDFSNLHYKKGKMYKCISKKKDWINLIIEKRITFKRNELQKKRENVIAAHAHTMEEWRKLYLLRYASHLEEFFIYFKVNENQMKINSIAGNEDFFESFIENDNINYDYFNLNYNGSYSLQGKSKTISFQTIENEVDPKQSYVQKKGAINKTVSDLDDELLLLDIEEKKIKAYSLSNLLKKYPEMRNSEDFKNIELTDLMFNFLLKGYIDEYYYMYISLFYGVTMTLNDRNVLIDITNDNLKGYDVRVQSPKEIAAELDLSAFDLPSILNFDIFDYLVKNKKDSADTRYNSFMSHFDDNQYFDFIVEYYKSDRNNKDILCTYLVSRDNSWEYIQSYEKQQYQKTLQEAWLKYCTSDNITNNIILWLDGHLDFLDENLTNLELEHVESLIKQCKFEDLTSISKQNNKLNGKSNLAQHIINNKLFVLSANNLCIASNILKVRTTIETLNLTAVLNTENENFKTYVLENISECMKNCFSKTATNESQSALLEILNKETISDGDKSSYLSKQTTKIEDIQEVEKNNRNIGFTSNVIKASWTNIYQFYVDNDNQLSLEIIDFIIKNVSQLSAESYPLSLTCDIPARFVFDAIFDINDYRKIVPKLQPALKPGDEERLSIQMGLDRISFLVEKKYLPFSIEVLGKIKSCNDDKIIALYVSTYKDNILANIDNYELSGQVFALLFDKMYGLSKEEKHILAGHVNKEKLEQSLDLNNKLGKLMSESDLRLSWEQILIVLKNTADVAVKTKLANLLIKENQDHDKINEVVNAMPDSYRDSLNNVSPMKSE